MPDTSSRPARSPGETGGGSTGPRAAAFEHGRRGFQTLTRTHAYEPLVIEGELPAGLAGTLVRNGPGAYECFGDRYGHWFDGDGAVSAIRIAAGRAEGAVRFVETPDRAAERAAGRRLYANFGTRPPSLRAHLHSVRERRIKQAANTNVVAWQRRLLALHEGSPPAELELDTLETLGLTDLGVLAGCMSAHPHTVASHRCTYNFGLAQRGRPGFHVYALPEAGPGRHLVRVPLRGPMMIHDFIASERHLIFLLAPVVLAVLPMLLLGRSYVEALRWRPELGTEVVLVPIDAPERVRRFSVDPLFMFHFANAFESGSGGDAEIIVDLVQYPDFPIINRWLTELIQPGPVRTAIDGTLARARIDPRAETLRVEPMLGSCEFPRIAPAVEGARHRFVYLAGHAQQRGVRPGAQDHLIKYEPDADRRAAWDFGPETYPSEPVFVPDPARASREDGGWLLSVVYDGLRDRSYLAVVDAEQPQRGVLARAWFDHHLPPSFHGSWIPAA